MANDKQISLSFIHLGVDTKQCFHRAEQGDEKKREKGNMAISGHGASLPASPSMLFETILAACASSYHPYIQLLSLSTDPYQTLL